MDRVDEELAAKHGTTVSDASLSEEAQPRNKAQDIDQLRRKMRAETVREGGGIIGRIKALFHHADRDLAGEYERREDADAPRNPAAPMREQQPRGGGRQT